MIAKLFKGTKTKYNSENQESEKVDGTDVDLQWEADEATIFKRYQAFYGSWIMNKLKEWKCTLSSSTSSTYRLKCCHLGCCENIVSIGQTFQGH